jgi:hypothetical protein
MKTFLKLAGIGLIYLAVGFVSHAQSCSPTNPCVQVSVTNPNALPSSTALWTCVGMVSTNCTSAQLQSAISGQAPDNLCGGFAGPSTGNWKCLQFSQTKTPQLYNDPHSWGSTINYSAQGVNGSGGVSATAPIITFQLAAQAQVPVVGSPVLAVSGSVGLQP